MFRFRARQNADEGRFCVVAPRRPREFLYAIVLVLVLGSATCMVLLMGMVWPTQDSVTSESAKFRDHYPATVGYSAANRVLDR